MNRAVFIELLSIAIALLMIAGSLLAGILIGRRLRKGPPPAADRPSLAAELFEQMRDAALAVRNGRIVDANRAAEQLFGLTRDELLGKASVTLLADAQDASRITEALRTGPILDFPVRLRCGRDRIRLCALTATGLFNVEGDVIEVRALVQDVTERNRIVAELRSKVEAYRAAFENAFDAILLLDPKTQAIVNANKRASAVYGLSRDQLIGRSLTDLSVSPRPLVFKHSGETRYETLELQQLHSDGTVIDVEINPSDFSMDGRPLILSMVRDVTEKKRKEQSVHDSEERFRLLLEAVTDYAIIMLDPIGRVVSWNEGAQRITGYAENEVLGKSAEIFGVSDDEETLRGQLRRAASAGTAEREVTRVRKDGSRFAASEIVTRIVDETGSLRGYAQVTRDITPRVQLEQVRAEMMAVLENVAREWRGTFDAVQLPIVLIGRSGEIRRLNRAAQLLAGRSFRELIHGRATDLTSEPWPTMARMAQAAFENGDPEPTRVSSGESVWQVSTAMAGAGENESAIVIAYDLTEVARLETSLRRSEVAAALGSLVARVAHEVRNPLFAISATLDAWQARFVRDEGLARYGGALRDQVSRLNRLMNDLLGYGKPHSLVLTEASLEDVILAASADCSALAAQFGVEIVHELAELPRVRIDAERMEQAFQNVIDNAIRHCPRGGTVHLVAMTERDGVVCRVIDEGTGIGDQDPEKIFAPMYSQRRGGTGLGMAIVRNIVTAHGGTVTIANREDASGAVATIRLPLQAPSQLSGGGQRTLIPSETATE